MKKSAWKGAAALTVLIGATLGAVGQAAADDTPLGRRISSYLSVRDGTLLKYSVLLPHGSGQRGDGKFPVVMNYSGYDAGSIGGKAYQQGQTGMLPDLDEALLKHGYAVLGVNLRGSGCSEGDFRLFDEIWGRDGADAVEWAASQPWSTGRVGMANFSFAGITQLYVGSEAPPHLAALAPGMVVADPLRDTSRPGGVPNSQFSFLWWAEILKEWGNAQSSAQEDGDVACLANVTSNIVFGQTDSPIVESLLNPYITPEIETRNLWQRTSRIRVPVLSMEAWQDEATGPSGGYYQETLNPETTWYVGTNGIHPSYAGLHFQETLLKFFDRYLKDEANGFESTPHVQIWQETTPGSLSPEDRPLWSTITPGWIIERPRLPVNVTPVELELDGSGLLTNTGRGHSERPDTYSYPEPSPAINALLASEGEDWTTMEPSAGGSLAYTTPPIDRTATFFGSGSADLWISSSGTDADVQVTITEVRPDGHEQYVQRGWLRLSERALDPTRTTTLRPLLKLTSEATDLLTPEEPVLARIEIRKFSHTFRAGSAIRVWIDTPGPTGLWGFDIVATPATNKIWHDAKHPSKIVLGLLQAAEAANPLPDCNTILSEPCRQNPIPVPTAKVLTLPVAGPLPVTSPPQVANPPQVESAVPVASPEAGAPPDEEYSAPDDRIEHATEGASSGAQTASQSPGGCSLSSEQRGRPTMLPVLFGLFAIAAVRRRRLPRALRGASGSRVARSVIGG